MKKVDFLTFLTLLGLSSFMGCAGFSKKTIEIQKNHAERLESIDKKIQEHEQVFSSLNSFDENLEKRIEKVLQKVAHAEANYLQIHSMLKALDSKVETENTSMKNAISEAQKNISNFEKILSIIQEEKNDLQNQIVTLQSQISHITTEIEEHNKQSVSLFPSPTEQGSASNEKQTDEEKPKGDKITGSLVTKQEKEVLQDLLDKALALYRNENYEESLNTWEKALAIDPENLEAKLNIEIVKEKIKSLSRN
ncbi:MAG: hypothetical protein QY310_07660 [Candidatus Jettenia sp. CY-1]|nr:MAG: hypothetical protein QY310_07660 [Candidatus Jettenia sp. CY-1]